MSVGQQPTGANTFSSSKAKESADKVVNVKTGLEIFIDSCITDLVKKYSTVGQEQLKTIAQDCKASIPADYSAPLTQECDEKLVAITNIDLEISAIVNSCHSIAPLLGVCSTSILVAEAKLSVVVSASELKKLDDLSKVASSKSKTSLDDCFSNRVAIITSH